MITVGIGEYAVTRDPREILVTHALGSCVAFIIRCPKTKKTALLHIVLPNTDQIEQKQYLLEKPAYFADAIIPKIIDEFCLHAECGLSQLEISIVGGAEAKRDGDVFRVGQRNVEKIIQYIKFYELEPIKIDVGGSVSRTVFVHVGDGSVDIRKQKMII